MLTVCPRFLTFLLICAMVSISLVGFGVEAQGRINGLPFCRASKRPLAAAEPRQSPHK